MAIKVCVDFPASDIRGVFYLGTSCYPWPRFGLWTFNPWFFVHAESRHWKWDRRFGQQKSDIYTWSSVPTTG